MIYVIVLLTAASVACLVLGLANVVLQGQERAVRVRLNQIRDGGVSREAEARRRRQARRESLQTFMELLGQRVTRDSIRIRGIRKQLVQAGYRAPGAVAVYFGIRVVLTVGFALLSIPLATILPLGPFGRVVAVVYLAAGGWMLPFLYLKRKVNQRARSLQRGLADGLDLMVVCVEAGLGLNQSLLRVAEEMDRISPEMSDELTMVTLEMRAGTPREEALRNLAERTGLEDVRAWVGAMIQTDRFGTSIADSLRVHSDTMRTKRRQRAEEAAAKLTVKMLIPMVLFVFPAMFVVVLAPAVMAMMEVLR
jgi:tight adherence protein C